MTRPSGEDPPLAAGRPGADGSAPGASGKVRAHTPAFRRATWALFSAGFATFALLYSVQPLLPEFSADHGVSPAGAALALSLTTGLLAVSMLVASSLSEVLGRKRVMLVSLFASSLASLGVALVPGWEAILALRALMGLTLSGLPAVAMAYLVDEIDAPAVGRAMGLYVGGSAIGGMSGRVLVSVITDFAGWQVAVAAMSVLGLAASAIFWLALPPSRHFIARTPDVRALVRSLADHCRDLGLVLLFLEAFLLMGAFVTLYNYLGFRLQGPPYGLSRTEVGLIFTAYLLGSLASAWMGSLSDRHGRGRVFPAAILLMIAGLAATLSSALPVIVGGVCLATFGFFGAHSIASGWVGLRARTARAQASALYLLAYYMGSSVIGTLGGHLFAAGGWPPVAAGILTLAGVGLLIAILLSRLERTG